LKAKVKRIVYTLLNRWRRDKKVDKHVKELMEKHQLNTKTTGWSISYGYAFRGRWFDKEANKVFNEKSFTVEVYGVPISFIKELAEKLRDEFKQEMVIVEDYSTGERFSVEREYPVKLSEKRIASWVVRKYIAQMKEHRVILPDKRTGEIQFTMDHIVNDVKYRVQPDGVANLSAKDISLLTGDLDIDLRLIFKDGEWRVNRSQGDLIPLGGKKKSADAKTIREIGEKIIEAWKEFLHTSGRASWEKVH
jgi:hypothetical protein